ncbi:MAG TPA: carboxypeptidase-like regulatory domain-containing protein [Candidatus Thermoplasmatota archaeon]|nr:carboxypeptidase-like regulatory domain-containing protein [Candidatus Thermoplasmatota archaeon]
MRMSGPVMAALVFSAALAGCSAKSASTPADELAEAAGALDVHATSTTGVIRGVVVDTAIRPIGGVRVSVQVQGVARNTTTTAAGAFGFEDLPEGTYFLQAHKRGFADTQTSAGVEAGVSDPPIVKVQMLADASTQPSFDLYHFRGFLQCNVAVPLFFFPCEAPFYGSVGNDDFSASYNVTGNVTWVHTSLVWTPTQPVGTELYMNVGTPEEEIVGYTGGPSPQVVDISGKDATQFEDGVVVIEVSGNGEQGLAGAELNQDFDAYVVVFHGFEPLEGYSYWKDGEPKIPE